ncbi:MAG TPA: alpha/beta hydrolase-fold protein [Ktedonobacteraceae bacterium]|nr:alpha/beta hydrolase-fold protein [Ktedonobacteraceae bacterium]
MKRIQQFRLSRGAEICSQLLTLLLAFLSGGVLAALPLSSDLSSTIIALGLDPLRVRLLMALLLTAGAAGAGALVGRRKVGAMLGGGGFFSWSYLFGFFQIELQPVRDPLGNLEPLNQSMLVHTVLVLLALALLVAFVGAAVGRAVSEVLVNPLLLLVQTFWRYASLWRIARLKRAKIAGRTALVMASFSGKKVIVSWLAALLFATLCVLAASSIDLFLYTPDIGLHLAPILPSGNGNPVAGTLVEDSIVSPALDGQRKPFLVYLPPSYNTPQGRLKRYPTLYLLHGSPGTDSDWVAGGKAVQAANTLIALKKTSELILIMPDGNGSSRQTSEWGNSADGHQNMETYVAVDLVRYVDAKYRTLAQSSDRGIGGLSMGGFGAMNIALNYPATFGFVIALGGYYRAEGSIWGKKSAYLRANSPLDVLPKDRRAWHLHFYLGAATMDQPYYTDTQQFVQELKRLHLPYTLDIQHGYHDWKVWQTQLYNALPWLHWGG